MRNPYVYTGYIRILLSISMLVLNACTSNDIGPTTVAVRVTSTNTALSPTFPIPTQTKIITQTPLPTMSAEKVVARLQELLKTSTECSLPCWSGVVPGLTSVDEARSILEPFLAIVGEQGYEFSKESESYYMRPLSSGLLLGIEVLTKDNIVSLIYIQTEMTSDIYQKVYADPFYQDIMSAYTLEAVLTKYGKPDQILIRSFSELAGEFNPTQTLLYYPSMGIVVQYFSPNGLIMENHAFILPTCPPRGHISLRLFDPESDQTLDELLRLDDSFAEYKDISEATNMDLNEFYETYREYDEKTLATNCPAILKTLENIWPSEYSNP